MVPRARTRGRNGAIFGASHYRGKRDPTRLDTFQTVSLLDFSHLRAKGLEIRSSSQCATSADQGAYPPPTDHNDAVYGPSPHFPRRTPLPIPPALLSVGRVLRVVAADRHAKSPKSLRRTLNRCGVLHGQMAKVELAKRSEKPGKALTLGLRDRRNKVKQAYFAALGAKDGGPGGYSRPFSDGF